MKTSHFFYNLGPYAVKFVEDVSGVFIPSMNRSFSGIAAAATEIRVFVNMVTASSFGPEDGSVSESSPKDANFEAFGRDMTGLLA